MLNDAVCFKNVYIVTGYCYTDLRFGIDSLAALIKSKLGKEPLVPDTLYMAAWIKLGILPSVTAV